MTEPATTLSIVIPTLNEAASIQTVLAAARNITIPVDIIVADGASDDNTPELARGLADHVVAAPRGRARQMNAGARIAKSDYLLFLHADTYLPPHAGEQLLAAFANNAVWGRFDVCIDGKHRMLGVISRLMNARSRLTGIATGDQAIFVKRDIFERLGGFADQPLMEDIELSKRLLAHDRPVCLAGPAQTSGRRWERHGVWSTIFLMWRLRWRYWRGDNAQALAREYQR